VRKIRVEAHTSFKAHHTPDTHPSLSWRVGASLHLCFTLCVCVCVHHPGSNQVGGRLGVGDLVFSIGNYHTMSSINLYRELGLNHGFEYLVGPIALQHGPHLIL
jgi:hypothetical protein